MLGFTLFITKKNLDVLMTGGQNHVYSQPICPECPALNETPDKVLTMILGKFLFMRCELSVM